MMVKLFFLKSLLTLDVMEKLYSKLLMKNIYTCSDITFDLQRICIHFNWPRGYKKDRKLLHLFFVQQLTGQQLSFCKIKSSIATFEMKKNLVLGAKLYLEGVRSFSFLSHLSIYSLCKINLFRGFIVPSEGTKWQDPYFSLSEFAYFPTTRYDLSLWSELYDYGKIGMNILVTFSTKNWLVFNLMMSHLEFPLRS